MSARAAVLVALAVVAATSAPYVALRVMTPPSDEYYGLKAINSADHLSYVMWMVQAPEAPRPFLRNLYAASSVQPDVPVPFFWLLGRAAAALAIDPFLMLHLARVAAGVALVLTCHWLASVFAPAGAHTRAFLLLALSSGLPGFIPEAAPISAIHDSALMALSWALLLAALGTWRQGMLRGSLPLLLASGAAAAILAVVHPYDAVTYGAVALASMVLPVFPLAGLARMRRGLVALSAFAPGALFTITSVTASTEASTWAREPRPVLWWCFLSFGALPFAALSIVRRGGPRRDPFLVTWLVTGLVLVLVPSPLGRKLLQGLYAPLALLAAAGFDDLIARGRGRPARLTEVTLYPASVLMLLLDPFGILEAQRSLPRPMADDLRELRSLPQGTIVAPPEIAAFIPPLSGRAVTCGHHDLSHDRERCYDWERVTSGAMSAEELSRSGARFVITPRATPLGRGFEKVRDGRVIAIHRPSSKEQP